MGDSALLLPGALLVSFWLYLEKGSRELCARWTVYWMAVGGLVAATKLVYMAWAITLPGLDFIGLSGHSTMSAFVWPSMAAILTLQRREGLRIGAITVAATLAVLISLSRYVLRDHTASECVLGTLVGGTGSVLFIRGLRRTKRPPGHAALVALLLCGVLVLGFGHKFPSRQVLGQIARAMTGHSRVYTRVDIGYPEL